MKILLQDPFKSLAPFESDELSDLTIITGKNGSGKSQFLKLVGKDPANRDEIQGIRVRFEPAVTKIQFEGVVKLHEIIPTIEQWNTIVQQHYIWFDSLGVATKDLLKLVRENEIPIGKNPGKVELSYEDNRDLFRRVGLELSITGGPPRNIQTRIFQRVFGAAASESFRFVKDVCESRGKDETELTQTDFFLAPVRESAIDSADLFASNVEWIFYNYAKRREKNKRDKYDQDMHSEKNNAITDAEFVRKFPNPGHLINEILDRHRIDFNFHLGEERFVENVPFKVRFKKKSTGKQISFADLSSGESVIIGLIIKLFTAAYYGDNLSYPQLLVLDEPDAFLHPEMSKLLIDVLQETFAKKFNIKVIFSTHSPSTIALAPEESIYELSNVGSTTLKKVSKDYALNLLTSFVPTLSIDYKNHRQIFVESPTDVTYYQALYEKHSQHAKLDHKLYFISNAMGKGNCDQVSEVVSAMRKSGNATSYGVVDWDLKNKPTNFVYVHGLDERYSVENFIFDPIYLVSLLVQLKAHNIFIKTGLREDEDQYRIGEKCNEDLQRICNIIFIDFEDEFPAFPVHGDQKELFYLNGKSICVPLWFVTKQGHEIEEKLRIVFPALRKYANEGDLQAELTLIMAKSYPFVPLDSIELIEKLAKH